MRDGIRICIIVCSASSCLHAQPSKLILRYYMRQIGYTVGVWLQRYYRKDAAASLCHPVDMVGRAVSKADIRRASLDQ